ncbi:unnamed protein product [Wuchereria bancrofti]|uniref:C2H2-type domain-containing protein n=1 Tax=Wuchereria bancrofti TaxID=6293 RepID=A0A3P7EZP8_WUCBA|nr:unnamed protein product [Wuchereria bancrofti]
MKGSEALLLQLLADQSFTIILLKAENLKSIMSTKRKQFTPKAFKDDEAINSDYDGLHKEQEVQGKKRKQKNDGESEIDGKKSSSESSLLVKIIDMEIICSFCETRFDDIKTLQNHTLQNHQQRQQQQNIKVENDAVSLNNEICRNNDEGPSLVCQQCDTTLHGFAEFGYHMRTHLISKDQEQKCSFCSAIFTDPIIRLSHIVEHFMENSIRIQCKECPTVPIPFETRDLLAIHVQLIHDRSAVTLTVNNLQRNSSGNDFYKQQSENRLVKCLVCDIKFENEDELDFHRLIAHCKVPRSNRCADCQTQIQTVMHFKNHIREHMQDEYTVTCIICRQALRNDTQIDTHAKYHLQLSDNTLGWDRQCRICQQHFSSESLGLHVVEHSSNGDCPYCDRHLPDVGSLLTHIDSVHSDVEAAYHCSNCRQAFHFKSQLQHHHCPALACETLLKLTLLRSLQEQSSVLDQQQTHQCPYCPKMFGSESALQGHSHVHSTRAFRCDLCMLSFSSTQRLETHRKKHFAKKNFTCQICDVQFLNHDDLSLHVKIHGGTLTRCITAEPTMKTRFN